MEENTLLEVKDLRVVYKTDEATVHAVNGISFTLGERETIGLVGETGAGKTTTALTLLRLLPAAKSGSAEKTCSRKRSPRCAMFAALRSPLFSRIP